MVAKRTYIAFLEPLREGYVSRFPDLPGCASLGDDIDVAVLQAAEALSLHMEAMSEEGVPLPRARTLKEIAEGGDLPSEPFLYAAISAEEPEAAERVNVYLPKNLLEQIEAFGRKTGVDNRSTFLRTAARSYLRQKGDEANLIPAQFADFRWKVRRDDQAVSEVGVVDQRRIISGETRDDLTFDRNLGASCAPWMKGDPYYSPEGVFVSLAVRGFDGADSLLQCLGQFARVAGCGWARTMEAALRSKLSPPEAPPS